MLNAEEIWSNACKILKEDMNNVSYETWIKSALKPYAVIDNSFLLECVNALMRDFGVDRYQTKIQNAVATAAGRALTVEILNHDELLSRKTELEAKQAAAAEKKAQEEARLAALEQQRLEEKKARDEAAAL